MGQIAVVESVTLDGVMQGLGAPDEDPRGGFAHGGWGPPYADEVMMREMTSGFGAPSPEPAAMLFGRRTYEQFATYWPHQPDENPFAAHLRATTKHVVSDTLAEPLPWENSAVLGYADVAALRETTALTVLGSGALVRSLLRDGLVDVLTLSIHPLLLGSGIRLFGEGDLARMTLERSVPTTTGVIIATYRPTD